MAKYSGFVDTVNSNLVAGWLHDAELPQKRIDVVVIQGEKVLGKATCTEFRPDLLKIGIADGKYGFRIELTASLLDLKAPISLYFYDEGKILPFPGTSVFEIPADDFSEQSSSLDNTDSLWSKIIKSDLENFEGCRELMKEILPKGGSSRFWKSFRQNLIVASEDQRRKLFVSLARNNGVYKGDFLIASDQINSWMSRGEVKYFSKSSIPTATNLNSIDSASIISELYMMALGRMPDEKGLKDYSIAIEDGLPLEEVWESLTNSEEFFLLDRDQYINIDDRVSTGITIGYDDPKELPFASYYTDRQIENDSLNVNRVYYMKSSNEKQYVVAYLSKGDEYFLGEGVVIEGMYSDENTSIMRSDPGFLLYGMKLDLAPGAYVLDLHIEAADWSTYAVDVVSDFGFHKLFHSDLSGSSKFRATFNVGSNNTFVEPRLITLNNNASLRVVQILIYKK